MFTVRVPNRGRNHSHADELDFEIFSRFHVRGWVRRVGRVWVIDYRLKKEDHAKKLVLLLSDYGARLVPSF